MSEWNSALQGTHSDPAPITEPSWKGSGPKERSTVSNTMEPGIYSDPKEDTEASVDVSVKNIPLKLNMIKNGTHSDPTPVTEFSWKRSGWKERERFTVSDTEVYCTYSHLKEDLKASVKVSW